MGKPLEIAVERYAGTALRKVWPATAYLKVGFEGWPDRLALLGDDQHFWIEFKRKGEDLRPDQRVRIADLVRHGETVLVLDDRKDVDALVEAIRYVHPRTARFVRAQVRTFAYVHETTQRALLASGAVRAADRRPQAAGCAVAAGPR